LDGSSSARCESTVTRGALLSARHLALVGGAVSHVELEHHILVHAGLAPNVPLPQ